MPKPPLPSEIEEFLAKPNPSVIATLALDGSPHSAATWYLWEHGQALVNMDSSRKRLEHLRRDPRVSLTVLDKEEWYRQVTLRGRATLQPDDDLQDIDAAVPVESHCLGHLSSFRGLDAPRAA